MDINAQNTKHKPQKICLPANSFSGCATLQNKYWLGYVGVRLYDANGTVVDEVSKDQHAQGPDLRELANTGEMVKVCYPAESEEASPIVTMQNRGETVLVLYRGSVPPSECYK